MFKDNSRPEVSCFPFGCLCLCWCVCVCMCVCVYVCVCVCVCVCVSDEGIYSNVPARPITTPLAALTVETSRI